MSSPLSEEGMSYVEKLDFREQEHRHRLAFEVEKTRQVAERSRADAVRSRWQMLAVICAVVAVLAVICAVVLAIYRHSVSPDASSGRELQREQSCVQSGGGWVPRQLLARSSAGLCVHPGQSVKP